MGELSGDILQQLDGEGEHDGGQEGQGGEAGGVSQVVVGGDIHVLVTQIVVTHAHLI